MHPVALESCQVLTLFGKKYLEIGLEFDSRPRRPEVGAPKAQQATRRWEKEGLRGAATSLS